jgi:hypothetical protein
MPKWDASELVFLDESAANKRTSDRKRGWSLKGLICPTSVPIKKSERWSILPALTIDGYLDFEIFMNFVEQKVLPHCNPRPGPRSVLVLDNASIH